MDDRSSPRASTPSSEATDYGKRSPFQAARPEPLLTGAIPVAGETIGFQRFYPTVQAAVQALARFQGAQA